MAATKTTKKTTTKAAVEVKSIEQMRTELVAKHEGLLETRRSHRAGELVNPRVITHSRKEIARLKTAIRAEELKEKKNG